MNTTTTAVCRYVAKDEPRILRGRHYADDMVDEEGIAIHSGDACKGCLPCPDEHCIVCKVEHVEQVKTCPACLTNTRQRVRTVYGLHKHLATEAQVGGQDGRLAAARPIPGGEATVLMAPGSLGKAIAWAEEYAILAEAAGLPIPDTSHKKLERLGEPMPTELLIRQWEDDWRTQLGNRATKPVPFIESIKFLLEHLSWAAQNTDSFPEFVHDITNHVALLEGVLHDGTRLENGSAPCFRCGGDLERKAAEPNPCKHARIAQQISEHWNEPRFTTTHLLAYLDRHYENTLGKEHKDCDQGGASDTYQCKQCRWRYDPASYWLAVRAEINKQTEKKQLATGDAVVALTKVTDFKLTPWQEQWIRDHFNNPTTPTTLNDPRRNR